MRSLSRALLCVYLLILLWLTLFKFSVHPSTVLVHRVRSVNLNPLSASSLSDVRDIVANVVVFVPLGLLLNVNFKWGPWWRNLGYVLALSIAIESAQYVFAIGITDVTDVITNTLGGLIGLLLYNVSSRIISHESLRSVIDVVGTILLALFVVLVGVALTHHVRFDHHHLNPRPISGSPPVGRQ